MYQTHSMSIFSLCQILSRLLLLTWAHLRNAFAPSHLSSITSASIFAPSSERTSHILAIVRHFIALFEFMLVVKGSKLFALITFCWHFQFLSWFVPPPQAHLPTCLICGLFCPETCPRHGKQNYRDLPPRWTKWKKIKLPQTQRVHISLMTTLAEKAGRVSFSDQYCKWKVASVASRGRKTWVAG